MLIWGFFISSTVLFHATVTINSLDHMLGTRRYDTPDTSRNNFALALLTLGEGWHNNHHHYAISARQGFFWWEIDITYYLLKAMSWLGIVWDLRPVPEHVRTPGRSSAQRPIPPQ
jgi:stearoyl-CoA desaturase (Delta-9 desaturase)